MSTSKVYIWSWHATDVTPADSDVVYEPMFWVGGDSGNGPSEQGLPGNSSTDRWSSDTMVELARLHFANNTSDERKACFLWHWLGSATANADHTPAAGNHRALEPDPIDRPWVRFNDKHVDFTFYFNFANEFFRGLRSNGINPSLYVLDTEYGIDFWSHRNEVSGNTNREAQYTTAFNTITDLPAGMTSYYNSASNDVWGVTDNNPKSYQFANDWNRWAFEWRTKVFRASLGPYINHTGLDWPVSSWRDGEWVKMKTKGAYEMWRPPVGYASPECYLNDQESLNYLTLGTHANSKEIMWRRFVYNINVVREACERYGPDKVYPWVANARHRGGPVGTVNENTVAWLWGEQLRHFVSMGITNILMWNPNMDGTVDGTTHQDVFDDLAYLRKHNYDSQNQDYTMLDFDTNFVGTGQWITRYTDYDDKVTFPWVV